MATETKTKPRETTSDDSIVDHLRRRGGCTIQELEELAGVTPTAIRLRLKRLMDQGLVVREAKVRAGRGRPIHQYSLSKAGERSSGNNYGDLAEILWAELRAVKDPEVRRGMLQRIVDRLKDNYLPQISGDDLKSRMESLVGLMAERKVPFEIQEDEQGLPVLAALSCPYPDLAEQDRAICAMEKMLFSDLLGDGLRLSGCRLDGDQCCTFEGASPVVPVL